MNDTPDTPQTPAPQEPQPTTPVEQPSVAQPEATASQPASQPEAMQPAAQPAPAQSTLEQPQPVVATQQPVPPQPAAQQAVPQPPVTGQPAAAPKSPTLAVVALVIGIIAVVLALVPVLGFLLGVTALILALVARKKYLPNKLWISGVITGGIATAVGAVIMVMIVVSMVIGLSSIFGDVSKSSESTKDYPQAVASIEATEKTFSGDEVATIGPYDVTVVSVMPNATPTAEDQTRMDSIRSGSFADRYGLSISESQASYTEVTYNIKKNDDKAAMRVQESGYSWSETFRTMELDGVVPVRPFPKALDDYELTKNDVTDTASGYTFTMLYRVPKGDIPSTLTYTITLYTSVSSFVGTEGMPSKEFIYTINLN